GPRHDRGAARRDRAARGAARPRAAADRRAAPGTRARARLPAGRAVRRVPARRAARSVTLRAMSDPVSWYMIRSGWKVLAVDGSEVGKVDEVAGDENADIFDGLAIATSALGKPRYVPSEQVAEITDGAVQLSLTREKVEQLGEYLEPATSAVIEPDSKGGIVE